MSREESSKKKKRRLEDLDTAELVKKCVGLIEARTSQPHNRSRRSHSSSCKENNNPEKKIRKSKQSGRSERSSCSSPNIRQTSAENKMADIEAALSGEQTSTAATPTDLSRSEHSSFVDEWKRIVREGLAAKEVEEIATKYKTSEDSVKELRAPELNAEVRSLVDATTLKIDDYYASRQNQSAVQLSVIARVLGLIAERGKQSREVARLVEYLHDFGRNNADIHHGISLARRHAIFSSLNIDDVETAEIQSEVGEKLFSRSMEMLLYKQKIRTDVEESVKPIVASMKEDFEEIVKPIAANWEKQFLEKLKEVAEELKKDLTQTQNTVVAPVEEPEESTVESGTPAVAAKVEGLRLAKVEGARLAKMEASSNAIPMSNVPSAHETYPGGEELAKRACEQRGVPNRYSTLAENTRNTYGRHIMAWWYFCQRKQKDIFQPSASDILDFYQEQARVRCAMDVCKRAMGHIMPERIVRDPNIILFIRDIKKEPL